jgi:hypothetical protein
VDSERGMSRWLALCRSTFSSYGCRRTPDAAVTWHRSRGCWYCWRRMSIDHRDHCTSKFRCWFKTKMDLYSNEISYTIEQMLIELNPSRGGDDTRFTRFYGGKTNKCLLRPLDYSLKLFKIIIKFFWHLLPFPSNTHSADIWLTDEVLKSWIIMCKPLNIQIRYKLHMASFCDRFEASHLAS